LFFSAKHLFCFLFMVILISAEVKRKTTLFRALIASRIMMPIG